MSPGSGGQIVIYLIYFFICYLTHDLSFLTHAYVPTSLWHLSAFCLLTHSFQLFSLYDPQGPHSCPLSPWQCCTFHLPFASLRRSWHTLNAVTATAKAKSKKVQWKLVLATAELQQKVIKSMKLVSLKEFLEQVKGLLSSILFASPLLTAAMIHMPFMTTNPARNP